MFFAYNVKLNCQLEYSQCSIFENISQKDHWLCIIPWDFVKCRSPSFGKTVLIMDMNWFGTKRKRIFW